MPEITFLIGLPASGKTTLARSLEGTLFEDAKELPLDVEGDFILDTPEFCVIERLASARSQAVAHYPQHSHRLIFFQNDPIQCLINALGRDKKPVASYIRWLSQRYNPPADAIPVYSKEGS